VDAPDGEKDPIVTALEARIGTPLNAKWTLERLLGYGGMGSVFAARHRNGSRAAIKLLHAEISSDAEVRRRFLLEGKIANAVDHASRVAVIDDDVSDRGEPFLVMELLEGRTLEEEMNEAGGKIAPQRALDVFVPVLDLLAKAHGASIFHRDIKPANVFVTKGGDVKVLDFGVARMREQRASANSKATQAGMAIGTPSFMSPEQAVGVAELDGRADLFSVGACLYAMMSGFFLNEGRSAAESVVIAATRHAPSIAKAMPHLPPAVVAFVDKALAFDKERRFPDAATMRDELKSLATRLRTGRIDTAPQPQGGLVVRGSDAVDDETKAGADRRARIDRMLAVWKQIGICLSDLRQYGWKHPQATRSLENAFRQVVDTLRADANGVVWEVGAGAFLCDEEAIWAPDRMPFDRIPYQLFADGVRKIQLKEGIDEREFRDLMAIFLRELTKTAADEDDSVTALWDRRFEHVAYVALDSFGEGSDDAQDLDKRCGRIVAEATKQTRIDKDWDELNAQAQALQTSLSALLQEASDSAQSVASDPASRAGLGAQAELDEPAWRERYVDAFAEAYHDGRKQGDLETLEVALAAWAKDELGLARHVEVFEMSEAILGAVARGKDELAAKAAERDVVRVMFSADTLGPVLTALVKDGRARVDTKPTVDAEIVSGLKRGLALLEGDALLGLACECYDVMPVDDLRAVLVAYIERCAKGREAQMAQLAQMLGKAGPDLGKLLVRLLCAAGKYGEALEGALKNADVGVRLDAITSMPGELAERVNKELGLMLADESQPLRLEALRIAAERGIKAVGARIVLRIKVASFHTLTIDERKCWLDALVKLNAKRGEEIAIELLTGSQVIPTDAVEETRTLAAEVLAKMASKEALEAARRAAKKRWWNTARVRDAAERAEAAIEAALKARARQSVAKAEET
jgi:serine/threonine protein kinase